MRIRSAAFRRYVSLLGVACFLLPFVSVTECKTKAVTGYSGYELLFRDGGWIYLVPVVTAFILFASSFSKRKWSLPFSGFSSAGACVLSCLSFASVVFFPEVQFLFDEVRPRVGQILCSLCWAALYAACAAAAFTIYRMMRRAGGASAVSGARLLPWTILLVLCGCVFRSKFPLIPGNSFHADPEKYLPNV